MFHSPERAVELDEDVMVGDVAVSHTRRHQHARPARQKRKEAHGAGFHGIRITGDEVWGFRDAEASMPGCFETRKKRLIFLSRALASDARGAIAYSRKGSDEHSNALDFAPLSAVSAPLSAVSAPLSAVSAPPQP